MTPARFSTLLLLTLTALTAAPPLEHVANRYLVELSGEPAAAAMARRGQTAHFASPEFQAHVSRIRTEQATARRSLEGLGARVLQSTQTVANTLSVEMTPEMAQTVAQMPGVLRVRPVLVYHTTLDHALPLHKVPDAWNLIGGKANAGSGMKVAIIDTGIDVQHPAFSDAGFTAPDGFPRVDRDANKAFTNNRIIVARSYGTQADSGDNPTALDVVGHGTGVAMAAGGETVTGPYGTITGVAPAAWLGNYKVFPDTGTTGAPEDLIIKALDDAVSDGMDVMNLSLGSYPATVLDGDILTDGVQRTIAAGRIVTISAGNSGPDALSIGSPGSAPDAITVGNMLNDRTFSGTAVVGGIGPVIAIPGDGPNSDTPITASLVDVTSVDPTGLGCDSFPAGSLQGSIALILRGVCTFEIKINNAQQAGAVAALIYTDAARPDAGNMSVGSATLPASMVSYQSGIQFKNALAAGPQSATLNFTLTAVAINANAVSSSSSIGPDVNYGIKPDLLAVGTSISTAKPGGFIVESGTSFSSPLVAGAAALLKAARPGLSAAQYRSLLINSTGPLDPAAAVPLSLQRTGSGILNMVSSLQSTIGAAPVSLSYGAGNGTLDQTKTLNITNLGTVSDTFSLQVIAYNTGSVAPLLSTSSVALDPGQSKDVQVQFTNSGLSAGVYQGQIQIQGNQGPITAHVPYWYGVPDQTGVALTVIYAPTTSKTNTTKYIDFRVFDASGLPIVLANAPAVTATSPQGKVLNVYAINDVVPGAYEAQVRTGTSVNTVETFHIDAGGFQKDVSFPISNKTTP